MEKNLTIQHENIESYSGRKNLFFQTLFFLILFPIAIILPDKVFLSYIVFLFFVVCIYFYSEYNKLKFYLIDFHSDSEKVEIIYFKGNKQFDLNSSLKKVKISLLNKSSKSGFRSEIKIRIGDISFTIEKNNDWSYQEMKELFLYVKFHKEEKISENENFILSRIEEHLKKSPF